MSNKHIIAHEGFAASGVHYTAGEQYAVGVDISKEDAEACISLGRCAYVDEGDDGAAGKKRGK